MHEHVFIPSIKADIFYCKICQKLSYKGIMCQSLPLNYNPKLPIDPLSLKFIPFSCETNYKSINHKKYLERRNLGIFQINYLVNTFGLKSMVFYKAISLMDQIYLKNEVSIDNIENISSICVLLVYKFNDSCMPFSKEDLTNNDNDVIFHSYNENNKINKNSENIGGLFQYIKSNVNNFIYWEVMCLNYLNYDLAKYSAYDYLILFFRLGLIFCRKNIDLIKKLKICLQILDYLIIETISFVYYSHYILAMSIIKVVFELEKNFDKKIFKKVYGVDLSKTKYVNCSNMIKNILNSKINFNNNLKNYYSFLLFNNIYNNNFIQTFLNVNNIIINNKIAFNSMGEINTEKNNKNKAYKNNKKNKKFINCPNIYEKNILDKITLNQLKAYNNSIIINNSINNNKINEFININNFYF